MVDKRTVYASENYVDEAVSSIGSSASNGNFLTNNDAIEMNNTLKKNTIKIVDHVKIDEFADQIKNEFGNPETAVSLYRTADVSTTDYFIGSTYYVILANEDREAVYFLHKNTTNDSNASIMITPTLLSNSTVCNVLITIRKDKSWSEGFAMTDSPGQTSIIFSVSKQSNTLELTNELRNLYVTIGASKANFLPLDNNNEYTPTNDYNPATKKYVDNAIESVTIDDDELDSGLSDIFN